MTTRSALLHAISQPVQLIYAGGTFGSYGRPLVPLASELFIPIFEKLITEHPDAVSLSANAWVDNSLIKDSSQLTPTDFMHFYQLLMTAYKLGQRQFILISGTDTLCYLGAFLAEAFAGSDICVILTGSMSPLLDSEILQSYEVDSNSDAWDNFRESLRLAAAGTSGIKICFGGESWPAQTVQKIHSHDFMAFTGHTRAAYPDNSYIERLPDTRRQHWLDDQLETINHLAKRQQLAAVHAIYCLPNDPEILALQLEALLSKPACAIILLGFGAGNIPFSERLAVALKAAYKLGFMIVCASQCPFGGVNDNYAAGSWQYDHHVIAGGRLTVSAIYARLLWLQLRYDTPARRRQRWTYSVNQTGTYGSRNR